MTKDYSAVAYEQTKVSAASYVDESKKRISVMPPINMADYKNAGLTKAGSVWDSLKTSASKYNAKPINEEDEGDNGPGEKSDEDTAVAGDQRTIDAEA